MISVGMVCENKHTDLLALRARWHGILGFEQAGFDVLASVEIDPPIVQLTNLIFLLDCTMQRCY